MEKGIESYGIEGIRSLIASLGQPAFRANQLVQWIYVKGASSYADMTNLPLSLRDTLENQAPLFIPQIVDKQVSKDGSRKYLLLLADGNQIETVGIPSNDKKQSGEPRRLTVCFSTQVGCPMGCVFCATGKEGLTRNLLPGEIVQQILCVQKDIGIPVTNAVGMGQGEPFLNFDNLAEALGLMNSSQALNIGARHITVSTCGIVSGINSFAKLPQQFTLAISLHAARQETRDVLMPGCAKTPLNDLKCALLHYQNESGRRITFEYLMIDGINDSSEDLNSLVSFCSGMQVHINIIPMNHISDSPYRPSSTHTMKQWVSELEKNRIETTIRFSRGSDIAGACGQLKSMTS